jgi:hypothetical protein
MSWSSFFKGESDNFVKLWQKAVLFLKYCIALMYASSNYGLDTQDVNSNVLMYMNEWVQEVAFISLLTHYIHSCWDCIYKLCKWNVQLLVKIYSVPLTKCFQMKMKNPNINYHETDFCTSVALTTKLRGYYSYIHTCMYINYVHSVPPHGHLYLIKY